MTRDEVRAAAKRVTRWHGQFAGLFGRKEPQGHSLVYLKGLMSDQKRKSVEPIALQFARAPNGEAAARKEVVALQGFLTKTWAADRKRRKKTRVPKQIQFRTKPQIAVEMLRRTRAAGKVQFDWIVADSLYGGSGEFLDGLEGMSQRYLVEVKKNTLVWTVDPATLPGATPGPKKRKKLGSYRYREVRSMQEVAADLPADAWRPLKLREGSRGPLVFEFAVLRVWAMRHDRPGPPIWLVIRRCTQQPVRIKES